MAIKTHCFTCRKRTASIVNHVPNKFRGYDKQAKCAICDSSKDIYYKTNYKDLLILFLFVLVVIASIFGICWGVYESIKLL